MTIKLSAKTLTWMTTCILSEYQTYGDFCAYLGVEPQTTQIPVDELRPGWEWYELVEETENLTVSCRRQAAPEFLKLAGDVT